MGVAVGLVAGVDLVVAGADLDLRGAVDLGAGLGLVWSG